MASQLASLAQSESKWRFVERLGMDLAAAEDRRVYNLMKAEAIQTREVMLSCRQSLLPHLRNDTSITPPYAISQIAEIAMQDAICQIYEHASIETKPIYDKGLEMSPTAKNAGRPAAQNWIIRWMLWHVFRYRDSRNKKTSTRSTAPTTANASQVSLDMLSSAVGDALEFSPTSPTDASTVLITLAPLHSITSAPDSLPALNVTEESLSLPSIKPHGTLRYDPVRDG